ncbi:MAG: GGDEF domain-containing protein [Geobacter sp.]|nr:GGDEF domain-containing protein [Geobacter sp.]
MARIVLRHFSSFLIPALLLVGAALVLPNVATLPPANHELVLYAPYALAGIGMLLSLHFHRGKIFSVLLLLACYYWFTRLASTHTLDPLTERLVFGAFALLLPFNITLFGFMREKGVATLAGRLRLGFLGAEGGAVLWVIRYRYIEAQHFLTQPVTMGPLAQFLRIPRTALAMFAIGLLLLSFRLLRKQSPLEGGLLGTLLALFVACNWPDAPDVQAVFISTAAIILGFCIIQASHDMAFRDEMTGLPARRALNELLAGLTRRYAIAMVDVDHFKRFNDTYGHDVGDQVLKMVATKIQRVSGGGKSFRYGGEEFTVVFPRKGANEALAHLEELRKSIEGYQLWIRGDDRPKKGEEGEKKRGNGTGDRSVSVTVSIGVAEHNDYLRTPTEVIKAADQALYKAKGRGRNQVCK